jgi:outer membrane protein
MKNLLIILVALLGTVSLAQAQKIAVIDLDMILQNMKEYTKAQDELDRIASEWRQEIANEQDKIKSMYNKYQAEQVLMSEEMRRAKEDEIINKEKEVRDMQRERFGPEGLLFRKRQELVQPIQEKIFAAIDAYAKERAFDIILEKSSAAGLLYVSDAMDKTEDIMRRLNIKK